MRWPIRKFFEIPANGAALVCEPCNGFEALGFRDGENAIVCNAAEVANVGRRLKIDIDAAQAIADAGRRLIGERHTLSVRASQLRHALDAAQDGKWHGAEWQEGELVPLSPPVDAAIGDHMTIGDVISSAPALGKLSTGRN